MRLASIINIDMYAEQRLEPVSCMHDRGCPNTDFAERRQAYKSFWDDISRQFLRHSDVLVLNRIIEVITRMEKVEALRAVNEAKAAELSNSLFEALNQALADKDLALASFEEEELQILDSVIVRLIRWAARHDLTQQFQPGDEGSGAFYAIILAIANRGKLGYREEALVSSIVFFYKILPLNNVCLLTGRQTCSLPAFRNLVLDYAKAEIGGNRERWPSKSTGRASAGRGTTIVSGIVSRRNYKRGRAC